MALVLNRWWVLLLAGVATALIGYAVAQNLPKTYRSEVKLLVGPVNTDIALDASGALARTYGELATSRPVLQHAIRKTGAGIPPLELEKQVTTTSNDVTRVTAVTVDHEEPLMAARLAREIANRVRTVANDEPRVIGTTIDVFASRDELALLTERERRRVIRAAQATFGPSALGRVSIIEPAIAPRDPVAPVVPLIVVLSGLGGMVFAFLVIVAREARRLEREMEPAPEDTFRVVTQHRQAV